MDVAVRQGSLADVENREVLLSSIPPSCRARDGHAYLSTVAGSRLGVPASSGTRACPPTHDDASAAPVHPSSLSDSRGLSAYLDTWTGASGRDHVDCRPAATGLLCCTVPMLIDVPAASIQFILLL